MEPAYTSPGHDQTDRYLLQQMSATEEQQFINDMQADPALAAAVEEQRRVILGIRRAAMENELSQFHATETQKPATVISFPARKLWMAAAIAGLLVACFWLFRPGAANQRLYTQYFKPDPGLLTAMGESDQYEFDKAMVDYKTGNYTAAITAWSKQLAVKPASDSLLYFIGVAELANDQAGKAIPYLEKTVAQKNSVFISDAYWYLALAWLKEQKPAEARKALEHSRHEKAADLTAALNK